ncbi:BON domain protein [compost metagenome]
MGIVTSGDLVKALLRQAEADTSSADACDDAQILARLVAELERQTWWSRAWSHVSVDNGIVMYHGMVGNEAERDAARVAAEGIAGVRGVVDEQLCTIEWQTMV